MCVYHEDRVKAPHITYRPENLKERLQLLLALPLWLWEGAADHVRVWWWDFKMMLRRD